jgi:hypothetical protein
MLVLNKDDQRYFFQLHAIPNMDLTSIAAYQYQQLVPSVPFMLVHATSISYYVTLHDPNANLFKLLVATYVLGFGGGILTSIILGQPMLFFFDNLIFGLYGMATIVVARTPLFTLLHINFKSIQKLFIIVDALARAYVMPSFLIDFRMLQPTNLSGKDSLLGQLVLTTFYVTGGGFLFSWFFRQDEFKIGGWFLRVIAFATAILVVLFEIIESSHGSSLYLVRQFLIQNHVDLDSVGLEHIQLLTACIVTVGFLVRSDVQENIEDDYVFVSEQEIDAEFHEQTIPSTLATTPEPPSIELNDEEEEQINGKPSARKRRTKLATPETPRRSNRIRK